MGKIICDVCGTTYPDTAQRCPICGCTRDEAASLFGSELKMDELLMDTKPSSQPAKKREIFDFDEANVGPKTAPASTKREEYEEEDFEEPPKQHTALVVLLTALIALLLIGAAFLFFRYYLPGMNDKETVPPMTTPPTVQAQPTETTEPTIPCESIALLSGHATGEAELVSPGQKFLINVHVLPENTTDQLRFVSADESIAVVSEDGQVTAVGEGETIINVICGVIEAPCKVSCNFAKETEPPTEATTEPTETEEVDEGQKDVKLKLKKTDIRLKVYYEFQLELDCDLEQTEVEWSCEHPHIAKVDEEGNVTALKSGTTSVTAKYGDQEVSCMIRCYD